MAAATGVVATAALSLFLLMGVAFLGIGVRGVWRGVASRGWPTTPGVVVRSTTDTLVTRDTYGRRSSKTHAARIAVRYRVDGREYETETRRFGQIVGTTDPSDAALLRLRYPAGAAVTVAYDPGDPTIAAIEPGLHPEALAMPGAGLAFAFGGVLALMLFHASRAGGGMALGLTLFALAFCAMGAAMLTPGLVALWRGRASAHWPSTSGVIVAGRPPELPPDADPDSADAADTSRGWRIQAGRLVYAYDVDGRRYFANVRTFGQVSRGGGGPDEAIGARYPIGRRVTVRYAPGRPELAVLEPGVAGEAWLLPAVGAAFLLFGLAVIRWGVPALA
jgi:hypothetical protein